MKEIDDLISIIVPVYNVERYLKKCLDSIINQTYKNLEIICIDDGSPDKSIDILNEFVKKDKRIKIIRQENKGLSSARNIGIKNSTGKYIAFIDSDDWIEPDMLELMITKAENENLDLVICGIFYDYYGKRYKTSLDEIKKYIKNKIDGVAYFKIVTSKTNLFTAYCWNKLYRLDLIRNKMLFFPEKKLFEDLFFTFQYLIYSENVNIVEKPLYHYIKRSSSISNTFNSQILEDTLFTLKSLKQFLIKKSEYSLLNSVEFKEYMFLWISRAVLFKLPFQENKFNKIEINQTIDDLKNDKNYKEYCEFILKNSKSKKNKLFIKVLYFDKFLLKMFIKLNYYKNKYGS